MTRPTTRAKLCAVLAGLERGMTRSAACATAALGRTSFYAALERPRYQEEVLAAEDRYRGHLEERMARAARVSWRAAAWVLERRWPDDYGPRQDVRLGGLDGGPLAMIVAKAMARTPEEQDAELLELLDVAFPDGLPGAEDADPGTPEA